MEINFVSKLSFEQLKWLIIYKPKKIRDENKFFVWNLNPPSILPVIFN